MTKEELLEYNKRCAEFLKWEKCDTVYRTVEYYNNEKVVGNATHPAHMKFHSDWNWIMEVRNKILSINSYSENGQRFTFNLNATAKFNKNENDMPYKVRIKGVSISMPRPFIEVNSFDEKEAVVQAINQFLIWYNKNKNLI